MGSLTQTDAELIAKAKEISERLTAQGFMRQPRGSKRGASYRIVSWLHDEVFPTTVPTTLEAKRRYLRKLGLDQTADMVSLDRALAMLPEAPTAAEASRRDAEGFKRGLTASELCAYKRNGTLPAST